MNSRVLHEEMTLIQMLGGILIILAVILINRYYMEKENGNIIEESVNNKGGI